MFETLPVAPWVLAVAMLITFLAAAVQSTIGFGFGIISVSILTLVDPRLTPVPQLLVTVPLTFSMAYRERHALELKGAAWVLAGRLPGAVIGVLLLKAMSVKMVSVMIGLIVLGAVVVIATGARIPRNRGTEFGAGILSGIGGIVSAISGPPLALLYGRDKGPTIRANLGAIFLVGVIVTIATRAAAGEISRTDLEVSAFLIIPLLLGVRASKSMLQKVEGAPIRRGVIGISAIAALALLGRAALN